MNLSPDFLFSQRQWVLRSYCIPELALTSYQEPLGIAVWSPDRIWMALALLGFDLWLHSPELDAGAESCAERIALQKNVGR